MTDNISEQEKKELTPEKGFNLVGIDFFEVPGNQLYLVEHFEIYQDILRAKKDRKHSDDFFILYKDSRNEYCCR